MHIPILNDECLEDDIESFNVLISTSDDDCVVIGASSSEVQVYIRDDDGNNYKVHNISQLLPATFACHLHTITFDFHHYNTIKVVQE